MKAKPKYNLSIYCTVLIQTTQIAANFIFSMSRYYSFYWYIDIEISHPPLTLITISNIALQSSRRNASKIFGYSITIIYISDINECKSHPCMHGGRCMDRVNAFKCLCKPGYTGTRCETRECY